MARNNLSFPPGWEWKPIGDLVTFEYGKGLRKDERNSEGSFRVYGSNGVVGNHDKYLVDKPCLIIGRKGAAGEVHISNKPCWPIDTTYFVIPPDDINLNYLYHLFSSINLASLDRSTAIPGLNRNDAYAINIPVPPLPEQERIVERIESLFTQLDAGVAGLKRVQAALKRYRASMLKAACEGRLMRSRDRDGNHGLLIGWELLKIGSFCNVSIGGTPSRSKPEYWSGNIPWVSSGEVINSRIRTAREFITEAGVQHSNAKMRAAGTVLLAMIGEGKTRGQSAILDISATTNQNIASIKPNIDKALPEWIFYWLQSRYEETRKSGSGGMQYALNSERIRDFNIPLPPLKEQLCIVTEVERRLSVVQELGQTVSASLKRAARLRQAILKQAFEGRLV